MVLSLFDSVNEKIEDKPINKGQKRDLELSGEEISYSGSPNKKFKFANSTKSNQESEHVQDTPFPTSSIGKIYQAVKSWINKLVSTEEVSVEHQNSASNKINRNMMTDLNIFQFSHKENENGNCSIEANKRDKGSHMRYGVPEKYSSAIKLSQVERKDFSLQFQSTDSTLYTPIRKRSIHKSYPTAEKKIASMSKKSIKMFKPTISRSYNTKPRNSMVKSTATASFLCGNVTAQESFKLDEKQRYKNLLQNYTSSAIQTSGNLTRKFFHRPAGDLSAFEKMQKSGAMIKEYFNSIWTKEKIPQLEMARKSPISSSTLSSRNNSKLIEVVDLENENNQQSSETDDDIIITKEFIKTSPVKNSLEERLRTSPFYTGHHFLERKEQYEWKKKQLSEATEAAIERVWMLERDRKQRESNIEDKLIARRLSNLVLTFPTRVIEVPKEPEDVSIILTDTMIGIIRRALRGGPYHEVLADKFSIQISRKDIHTLDGLNWLNDEVINFYMNLIMDRNQKKNLNKVYAFNTFFYPKLRTGYGSVRRWTKKIDIFSYKLLIVPVHLGAHWCLATIDFGDRTVRYYDSMHGDDHRCLEDLLTYLNSEHMDKKKSDYDTSNWKIENIKDIPQQMNGSDCGMFSCKFAEYLSRDASISFTQKHMPYYRRRMIYEICSLQLM